MQPVNSRDLLGLAAGVSSPLQGPCRHQYLLVLHAASELEGLARFSCGRVLPLTGSKAIRDGQFLAQVQLGVRTPKRTATNRQNTVRDDHYQINKVLRKTKLKSKHQNSLFNSLHICWISAQLRVSIGGTHPSISIEKQSTYLRIPKLIRTWEIIERLNNSGLA